MIRTNECTLCTLPAEAGLWPPLCPDCARAPFSNPESTWAALRALGLTPQPGMRALGGVLEGSAKGERYRTLRLAFVGLRTRLWVEPPKDGQLPPAGADGLVPVEVKFRGTVLRMTVFFTDCPMWVDALMATVQGRASVQVYDAPADAKEEARRRKLATDLMTLTAAPGRPDADEETIGHHDAIAARVLDLKAKRPDLSWPTLARREGVGLSSLKRWVADYQKRRGIGQPAGRPINAALVVEPDTPGD